jgi:hypothetical protein
MDKWQRGCGLMPQNFDSRAKLQYIQQKSSKTTISKKKKLTGRGRGSTKKFKCYICGKTFSTEDSLDRHVRTVHMQDSEEPLEGSGTKSKKSRKSGKIDFFIPDYVNFFRKIVLSHDETCLSMNVFAG